MREIPENPQSSIKVVKYLKSYLFYSVLLILLYFIPHNLLLVEHQQLDRKFLQAEQEFEELNIAYRKLNGEKDLRIGKIFKEQRKELKRYSIKNIPLVVFE